jgi:hypothetical protein
MWWERAVVHQVYLRSHADSNADGIGDLQGLISKLDHLEWLGVDASGSALHDHAAVRRLK